MSPVLSPQSKGLPPRHPALCARHTLLAFFLVAASLAIAAPSAANPEPNTEPKLTPVPLRDYLPPLLLQTLLDNEREYVVTLERFLKLFEGLREGGLISSAHLNQVEREFLRARISVLQREKDYGNSLDQLKLRFEVKPEHLQKMEESALLPVKRHVRRIEEVFSDYEAVRGELSKWDSPELVPKLRAEMRRISNAAALVQGTSFQKELPRRWAACEKLSDKELQQLLQRQAEECRKLLVVRAELEGKGQSLNEADRRRLRELDSEIDMGSFERSLRSYESQPWKDLRDAGRRRVTEFRSVASAFNLLLVQAYRERIDALREGWPKLSQVQVQKVNLLACAWEQAEQVVTTLVKKPDVAVTAKASLRQVRTLAETYRIQQRLFELSLVERQDGLDGWAPGLAPAEDNWKVDVDAAVRQLLEAERSSVRLRGQLLRTWIDYQIARLELFRDLGLESP